MPVNISIARKRGKAKIKVTEKRRLTQKMLEDLKIRDLDTKVSLIQSLIPLGLQAIAEELQMEFKMLAGERYLHGKDNSPWGENPGSVYLHDQKVPIMVPRVRNKKKNLEVGLPLYKKLQTPYLCDKKTVLKLLNGISMHKYKESVELVPEVFGLSASNLSKRFKKATEENLKELNTRSLAIYDFICVFIDGKRYAEDGILVALGVTIEGYKIILGIEQSHTENSLAINQFFDKLVERGLKYDQGMLFIIDGSKGIIKAIEDKFQEYGFIQRCIWHKEQNVISYLSKPQQEVCKIELKRSYKSTSYKDAMKSLEGLYNRLTITNESAASSLKEGIDETLTLHRLGLSSELCKSLNSTNCIESVMSQLGIYTDKVDRWQSSNQILRWTAAGLLEIEPNLKKIRGFRYLGLLRFKLKEEIQKRQKEKYGNIEEASVEAESDV
jgi:transposase-like protein